MTAKLKAFFVLFGILATLASQGRDACGAVSLGFTQITSNGVTNVSSQLSVDVSSDLLGNEDLDATQAVFTFHNVGSVASVIAQIYFDDGSLFDISSVVNSAGVDFSELGSPTDLPAGEDVNPDFVASAGFRATADSPAPANGVNATVGDTETVAIVFQLLSGKTFADTLAALQLPTPHTLTPEDNWLRIGLHVTGIGAGGKSESYINVPYDPTPPPPPGDVPEPATVVIWSLLGLVGVVHQVRRRRAS